MRTGLACALILMPLLAGCSSSEMTSRPDPSTDPLSEHPSRAYAGLTIDELAALLPDAVRSLRWAPLGITNEVTALRMRALTPDDRPVEIRARQSGETGVRVQARVGFFGDENEQERFHEALRRVIEQRRESG